MISKDARGESYKISKLWRAFRTLLDFVDSPWSRPTTIQAEAYLEQRSHMHASCKETRGVELKFRAITVVRDSDSDRIESFNLIARIRGSIHARTWFERDWKTAQVAKKIRVSLNNNKWRKRKSLLQ